MPRAGQKKNSASRGITGFEPGQIVGALPISGGAGSLLNPIAVF